MNEYTTALLFILLGAIGSIGHYIKKRYVDNTTKSTFMEYLLFDPKTTVRTSWAILTGEIALSLAIKEYPIHLGEIVGAITAGYMADSGLNAAPPKDE